MIMDVKPWLNSPKKFDSKINVVSVTFSSIHKTHKSYIYHFKRGNLEKWIDKHGWKK